MAGRRHSDEVDFSGERVVKIETECGLHEYMSLDHKGPD